MRLLPVRANHAAAALLKRNPKPADKDIDDAMTNTRRCGTYQRVRQEVHVAAGVGLIYLLSALPCHATAAASRRRPGRGDGGTGERHREIGFDSRHVKIRPSNFEPEEFPRRWPIAGQA